MSQDQRSKLVGLKAEIKVRDQYRREQEALINDLIERGNTQLMELTYDIKLMKQERATLKAEIRALRQDKQLLEADIQQRYEQLSLAPLVSA